MIHRLASAIAIGAATLVAGCDIRSTNDDNGAVSISMNSDAGAGNVAINVPGFQMKVDLPSDVMMKHGDFDIDGVKLYPGSKIINFNVDASTADTKTKDNAVVKIGYDAPADATKVKAWYLNAFKGKGVKAAETPGGISGATKDGNAFTMTFTPGDGGATKGTIVLTDRD